MALKRDPANKKPASKVDEVIDNVKDNGGKDAVSPDDIWVDDKGVKHYFSYMARVKPMNDKYMHRVPNNNWAETSEESAFYNPN